MCPTVLTRVGVISDDRLLSDAIVQHLSSQPDVSAATDGCAEAYDIVLIDARGNTRISAAASIPDRPAVIFLGAPDDDSWAIMALSTGARGILTRTASCDDLVNAIRVVRDGGIWARRRWLNQCVLNVVGASKKRLSTQQTLDARLSQREQEVLQLAAAGVCNKEIADSLSISEATVKAHLTHIFRKLGVTGRAALAAAYSDVRSLSAPTTVPVVLPSPRKIIPLAN